VNVTVTDGIVDWFVDWGLGGEGTLGGITIVCDVDDN
jgi:hypothetical protein